MPLMAKAFLSQFAAAQPFGQTTSTLAGTTSTVGLGCAFGFVASHVDIVNSKAAAIYVTFGSTTATTAGYKTCSGETLTVEGLPVSGCAIASTTTTTGVDVRVLALGW